MDNPDVKNVDVETTVFRSKQQHIHPVYFPYQKTVQAVPYYARKKRELKSKNYALNKEQELDKRSSKLSVDMNSSKGTKTQKNLRGMVSQISVEPVINDNKFTNFDPELYPLEQHEKVKVVDQKYFPLQNYYNYIWAVRTSDQVFRIAKQTEKKAQDALFGFLGELIDGDYDQSRKKGAIVKETMKIKGVYESRFNPYASVKRVNKEGNEEANKELAPMHVQYKPHQHKNSKLCVKQVERMTILKGAGKQQLKSGY